jgi:DNA-binding LytR/AlgR family response regulator
MQFVLRELQLLGRWRREIAVLLAVGVLLGSLGPYGTYDCFAVADRFGYWMLRSILVGLICLIAFHTVTAKKSCAAWPPTKQALAGVLAASIPCALIGFALASVFRQMPSTPLEVASLYGRVAIITMVVGIPLHLARTVFARGYEFLPAEVRPTRVAQSTELTFLRRLPAKLGTDLLCIEVEDHYLRVHTSKGNGLLLMRLSDAVAELDLTLGRQVHRSYWVAQRAVSAVDRDRYRVRLILSNGARVPVSRTFLPKLRAEGWL